MKKIKKPVKKEKVLTRKKANAILKALFSSSKVFIINTGIEVSLEYFAKNNYSKQYIIKVNLLDIPTSEALDKCIVFSSDLGYLTSSKKSYGSASIYLKNLSLTPFEGKMGNILYGK